MTPSNAESRCVTRAEFEAALERLEGATQWLRLPRGIRECPFAARIRRYVEQLEGAGCQKAVTARADAEGDTDQRHAGRPPSLSTDERVEGLARTMHDKCPSVNGTHTFADIAHARACARFLSESGALTMPEVLHRVISAKRKINVLTLDGDSYDRQAAAIKTITGGKP